MAKLKFNIGFYPMTCVEMEVKDEENITKEEEAAIISKAVAQITENIHDYINAENVDLFQRYDED